MKRILLLIVIVSLVGCVRKKDDKPSEIGFKITQGFHKSWDGSTELATFVYRDRQIIKAEWDNINRVTDSVRLKRIEEAKTYIEWIKKYQKDTVIYIK